MFKELKGDARIAKAERSLGEHPGLFTIGQSVIGGPDVLVGPDLASELPQILFPTSAVLTDNQRRDAEHLTLHIRSGGDLFVTLDESAFIKDGRQESFWARGIWVLTPPQAVDLLHELYEWE
jgi:hypothetical protein